MKGLKLFEKLPGEFSSAGLFGGFWDSSRISAKFLCFFSIHGKKKLFVANKYCLDLEKQVIG